MSDASPRAVRAGCLTEAELEALQAAPPGTAPEDLARHLAACERCQERALFGSQPRPRRTGAARTVLPSPTRMIILVALLLAAVAGFFYTLLLLTGGR